MRIIVAHTPVDKKNAQDADAIVDALRVLGHDAESLEVTNPLARFVARFEASPPDLVIHLPSSGTRRGRTHETWFPHLVETVGIPHSGSTAQVMSTCSNRAFTRSIVSRLGIRTPRTRFIDSVRAVNTTEMTFPLAVMGVEVDPHRNNAMAIIHAPSEVERAITDALSLSKEGVFLEERVLGRTIAMAWLDADRSGSRVLPPVEVRPVSGEAESAAVVPVDRDGLPSWTVDALNTSTSRIATELGLRGHAVLRFRVDESGNLSFADVDPCPSFAEGSELRVAATAAGITSLGALIERILAPVVMRYRLGQKPAGGSRRRPVRVALVFNVKRVKPGFGGADDAEAEFDSPTTIQALAEAITSHGHEVVKLEATPELASTLNPGDVDVAFNIAEGLRGRNRESQVPALLELLDIPYTGSDATTLSLSLDKGLAKRVVRHAGVLTPTWMVLMTGKEKLPRELTYPVIVKPVAEGSSKGVLEKSVAENEAEVREAARAIIERYRQGALVEEYLPGREFTVGLLGEAKPRALPPMEIVFAPGIKNPIYTFDHKLAYNDAVRYEAPAKVEPQLLREIERAAKGAFVALGCRDVARVDLRLDARGRVHFIECNPLPGLTPEWSDLCMVAKAAGLSYNALIGEILAPAIRRFRHKAALQRASASRASET